MRLRMPSVALALVLAAGVAASPADPVVSQAPPGAPEARWRLALDAWDAGDYPAALEALRALLQSPAAADYLARAAELTGERYVTTELTADGRNPRISDDGRWVAWETGPAADPTTQVVRLTAAGADLVATLRGGGAAFDAASRRVAWIRPPTALPAWRAAIAAAESGASPAERQAGQNEATWLVAAEGDIVVRTLEGGAERVVATPGLLKGSVTWAAGDAGLVIMGAEAGDLERSDLYLLRDGAAPERLTDQPGFKTNPVVDPSGAALLYTVSPAAPFRRATDPGPGRGGGRGGGVGGGRGGGPGAGGGASTAVVNLATRATRVITGLGVTLSADGRRLAWITRAPDGTNTLHAGPTLGEAAVVRTGRERLNAPALSPDGSLLAYELMQFTDWEIHVHDGTSHRRLTRDIQHDILPRFLSNTTLVATMGEARHRRSQVYDLATGARTRLFHNNTIRTVVPEYGWVPARSGRRIVIVADRDGDTVSPERSVSVVDLDRPVTVADVLARVERQLAAERDLRERMTAAYRPIADLVRSVVAKASVTRVWEYSRALFDFDSKHISQPGNGKAIEYLTRTYASFGYRPEPQWFAQANALGGRTANVLATLRGTAHPDLIYVVSSHFDSVAGGPGADDDSSGTAALLETARILADTPLPATIVFASFTGEEAGLLGSREFVRQAEAAGWRVVGALNNDMIGWAGESARIDNTIRYSNPGIRDLQHGAAFLFTGLITYDAKYYRSTDAAAFYEAWGDIVGGIGSYPILANPNYHQATDYLDTISQRQVTETAKVTAATLVYLASSPSRLGGLTAARAGAGVAVAWTPSPESDVIRYVVAYGPAADPFRTRVEVQGPRATLPAVPAGTHVAVRAVNARGLHGWDWARTVLQ